VKKLSLLLALTVLGLGAYQFNISQNDSRDSSMPNTGQEPIVIVEDVIQEPIVEDVVTDSSPLAHFSCDGRQHCSQMTSREEAVFFIRNCPDTKMDGDRDGIPCENDSRW
jgi:hypothetical protein